jgi:hypothetical protein
MKTIWLVALLGTISAQGQNVFILGSNTALPPDLNGNVQQPVAVAPAAVASAAPGTTVNVHVNVAPAQPCAQATYAQTAYYDPYYAQQYYSPNVMYIGGPGTCGPNSYNYYPQQSGSVIYFGGLQAYRQGYHFRHCR